MTLITTKRSFVYRETEVIIDFKAYRCIETGIQYTTGDLDEENMNNVLGEYRNSK